MALVVPRTKLQSGRMTVSYRDQYGRTYNARVVGPGTDSGLKLILSEKPPVAELSPPGSVTADPVATGGTLTGAPSTGTTYTYGVTSQGQVGETEISTTDTAVAAANEADGSSVITWAAVPGSEGYRIYGRVAGSLGLIGSVGRNTLTFADVGTPSPGAAAPSAKAVSTGRVLDNVPLATGMKQTAVYFNRN